MTAPDDAAAFLALQAVTTATLTTVLLKKGLRNVWLRGALPIPPQGQRCVGRAFTLRFIPPREDLATPESWSSPQSTRAAIEQRPPGCIAVGDANGVRGAGFWGDILCARMGRQGAAGLGRGGVGGGGVGGLAGGLSPGLPSGAPGGAPPPSAPALPFVAWHQPVGCGGVAV